MNGSMAVARWGAAAVVGLLSLAASLAAMGPGSAQPVLAPSAGSSGARAGDPALDAARAAFEALPEAERKAIQDALVWTGDQVGSVDGSFGRQTYEGLLAAQRRTRETANGILDAKARAALLAEGQSRRQAAGFAIVDDAKTGVRIGIPARILPKRDVNPNGGSRWQSADGKVTLDTRAVKEAEITLQSLYERNLAIQSPGRQVTYKVLRPDFFVITGETSGGKFYTRYASGPDGLRGFSIGYDKTLKDLDRLVVAIANSFVAYPDLAAPAPPAVTAQGPAPAPAKPTGPNVIGTGLVIAAGRVATTAPVEACQTLRVAGRRPSKVQAGKGLSVIEVDGIPASKPLRLAGGDGPGVLILSYGIAGENAQLLAAPGTVKGRTVAAPLQAGASGSAVFDRTGGLVGLVARVTASRPSVAGTIPVGDYGLVPASDLGLPPPDATGAQVISVGSAGVLAAALKAAVVPIVCLP